MTKNLKICFLLSFILSVVVIAWHTLTNFFGGVGINYVAVLVAIAVMLSIILFDKHTFSRFGDIFFICCLFAIFETIVYFPYEFGGCFNPRVACVFFNMQNVFTFFGILFLAYLAFRFIIESKNIRVTFVEVLLRNEKLPKNKKEKKSKEFSNGSLEEKPILNEEDEEVVITEEETIAEEAETIEENSEE